MAFIWVIQFRGHYSHFCLAFNVSITLHRAAPSPDMKLTTSTEARAMNLLMFISYFVLLPSRWMSVCNVLCLSVSLSVCPSAHLSICLFIHPSAHLSIYWHEAVSTKVKQVQDIYSYMVDQHGTFERISINHSINQSLDKSISQSICVQGREWKREVA